MRTFQVATHNLPFDELDAPDTGANASELTEFAHRCLAAGRFGNAYDAFFEAHQLEPHPRLLVGHAIAALYQHEPDEAIASCEEALEMGVRI